MDNEKENGPAGEWKVQRSPSGNFLISKPKRNRRKLRQSRLRNRLRAR